MNGILVIDKPLGYTSRDIVNIVCKHLETKKVGHTGTLDPMASGVLVLCVGKALKLSEILVCDEKIYEAKVILGIETDTLDLEGSIIKKDDNIKDITIDKIKEVLLDFVGEIVQEVPKYSAISVKGKRLYDYARSNIEVELPKRKVVIKSLKLISNIELNDNNNYEFLIRCEVSKGTYIRSLVRDIGYALGTVATMGGLRRIKSGVFDISSAYSIQDIENNKYKLLNPVDVIDMEKIIITDDKMKFKIINGQVLDKFFNSDKAMILDKDYNLLAIYKEIDNGLVKPWKMF